MPDITMCKGNGCRVRARCYRHIAKPNDRWQTWFEKVPKARPCPHRIKCRVTEAGLVFDKRA